MTEAEYGVKMAALAWSEGHRPTRFMKQPKGSLGLTKPVVTECFREGMTHKEIAEYIGVSVEAVARFTKRYDLGGVA